MKHRTQLVTSDNVVYDLAQKYTHFNATLFNGTLPTIPVFFKSLKNCGGVTCYSIYRTKNAFGKTISARLSDNSLLIKISSLFDRTEENMDGILVHEMIHVKMVITDHVMESHGVNFKNEVNRIQKLVNFNIPMVDYSFVIISRDTNPSISISICIWFPLNDKCSRNCDCFSRNISKSSCARII